MLLTIQTTKQPLVHFTCNNYGDKKTEELYNLEQLYVVKSGPQKQGILTLTFCHTSQMVKMDMAKHRHGSGTPQHVRVQMVTGTNAVTLVPVTI